jgi:hypothetical protein
MLEGVGGLIPQEEAAQQPHLPSSREFFWSQDFSNYFLGSEVQASIAGIFPGETTSFQQTGFDFEHLFSRRPGQYLSEKLSRNSRGGGGGGGRHDSFV